MRSTSLMGLSIAVFFSVSSGFASEAFEGPTFRKGMWHFTRTIELAHVRERVSRRESTACVDPTLAMKGIWDSPAIGGCASTAPVRIGASYVFANRCDYLGPAKTTITVHDTNSYTEVDEFKGSVPKIDTVVATRIGDCSEQNAAAGSLARVAAQR